MGELVNRKGRFDKMKIILAACAMMSVTVSAADAKPDRLMPFICRDAVVKESPEKTVLAGKEKAAVIISGKAAADASEKFNNEQIDKAAKTLEKWLVKISGAKVSVAKEAGNGERRIFIHSTGAPSAVFPELGKADAHGFVIAVKDGDLHIVGASGVGTLYGVWFFLQNYCDVRILMEGALGEVYSRRDNIEIPRDLHVFNPGPDFLLRIHSGTGGLDMGSWLADFGASQRFQYHHNTPAIYDPVRFGKAHPEWYPIYKGDRFIPKMKVSGWEPNFSDPGVVARAIEYADEMFKADPNLKSVSLTPNDDQNWSETDLAEAKKQGVGMNEIYFDFVNKVARHVKKNWPGRYVAFLLNYHFQDPPRKPMEDNVMGFIMDQKGNIEDDLKKWGPAIRNFGCYQWIYGSAYPFPNHYPHAFQDFLKLLHRHGAKALKTEFYDVPINGSPRLWVISNLLWNVDADVDALLRDYFERMYGKEAAPAMSRYWSQWEQVYERRRTPENFNLVDRKDGEAKFNPITDKDIEMLGQLLNEGMSKVVGEDNRRRIEFTAATFGRSAHYFEMCKHLKPLRQLTDKPEFANLEQAEKMLGTAASFMNAEESVYAWNVAKIEPEPALVYCSTADGKGRNPWPWKPFYLRMDPRIIHITSPDKDWVAVGRKINMIVQYISSQRLKNASPRDVAEYWKKRMDESPILKPYAESERLRLLHPDAPLSNVVQNGSFEVAGDPGTPEAKQLLADMRSNKINWVDCDHFTMPGVVCEGWNAIQNRETRPVKAVLDGEVKKNGNVSVRVQYVGQNMGGVATRVTLPDPNSRYRLSFWYRTTKNTQVMCYYMFYQVRHTPYGSSLKPASEEWTKVEIELPFNHTILPLETADMSLCLGIWSGGPESTAWFDDVRVERLSPAGLEKK